MNCLNFTGNLGSDAELRQTPNGKAVANFSVAMTSGWGDRKVTTWVRCALWGDRANSVVQYLTKGKTVAVTGEASLREWESNGKSGVSFECNVQNVTLCGGNDSAPSQQAAPQQQQPAQQSGGMSDMDDSDSIPF